MSPVKSLASVPKFAKKATRKALLAYYHPTTTLSLLSTVEFRQPWSKPKR